jgi:hypothetical protein
MRGFIPLLALAVGVFAAPRLPARQIAPAPASAPTATPAPDLLRIGERTDRMTVPVSIGPHGPFPFIVDTGAERSIVSRELAGYLKLAPGAPARLFDFTGPADVTTVKVPSLSAGALGTPSIEAPQLLMANIGAPGVLGIDALQGQKVVLDFNRRRMMLKPARRHASGDMVLPALSRTGQLIVTRAWYGDTPIAVVIDTGSWLSVGNSAMRRLLERPPKSYGRVVMTSVTGRSFSADFVSIAKVRIGSVRFDNFGMVFADVPPFERFGLGDRPALILGMSSLKLFGRVELDFVNREVAFTLPQTRIDFHQVCRNAADACNNFGMR